MNIAPTGFQTNHFMLIFILSLCVFMATMSTPVSAQSIRTITVATEAWENNTNEDGTGSFFDMIRKVYALENIEMEFIIVPYERSVEMTKDQKVDAWVAAYDEEEDFALFPEWHFDADIVTAVFKKNRFPDFKGVDSLAGPVISWIRGYAYDEYVENEMNIYRLDKRTSAMEMLVRDRIDIYLDAKAEVDTMVADDEYNRSIGFLPGQYAFTEVLRLNLYLAFSNSARSQDLIRIWDANFPRLLASGEVRRIYDQYGVADYPFDK